MSSRISSNINFGRSRQFHVYQSTYRQCEDPEINTNKEPVKEDEKNDEIPDIFGEIDESSTEKEEEKNEEEEKRIVLTLENLKVNFEDLKKIGMSEQEYTELDENVRPTINNIILRNKQKELDLEMKREKERKEAEKKKREEDKKREKEMSKMNKLRSTNNSDNTKPTRCNATTSTVIAGRFSRGKHATMADLF